MAREHTLKVTLTAAEFARLDELRPPGVTRPAFIRSLLREPPRTDDVATRDEALSILTRLARDGRVAAAIALARELRGETPRPPRRRSGMRSVRHGWSTRSCPKHGHRGLRVWSPIGPPTQSQPCHVRHTPDTEKPPHAGVF